MLKLLFQSIFLSFLHHPLPVFFFITLDLCCLPWFSHTAKFLTPSFFQYWIMCSPSVTRTHEETKARLSTREILLVKNIIYVEQIISTVKKLNQSPWQNFEVCQSHYWRNMQKFLLSLQQFFLPTYCQGKLAS